MQELGDLIKQTEQRRVRNAEQFKTHDGDLCMLCHARGQDKRSLFIKCFYDVNEVIPEALDIADIPDHGGGFYLRICKNCRGILLDKLSDWRSEMVHRRNVPKDHDGHDADQEDPERDIPVRVNGRVTMMTRAEWEVHSITTDPQQ